MCRDHELQKHAVLYSDSYTLQWVPSHLPGPRCYLDRQDSRHSSKIPECMVHMQVLLKYLFCLLIFGLFLAFVCLCVCVCVCLLVGLFPGGLIQGRGCGACD